MATPPSAAKTSESQTFEVSMERLEHLVGEMESDKIPLDDLLKYYEEGMKLVRVCEQKLKAAEQRIEIITRDASGEAQVEEFEPEKKAAPAPKDDISLF